MYYNRPTIFTINKWFLYNLYWVETNSRYNHFYITNSNYKFFSCYIHYHQQKDD